MMTDFRTVSTTVSTRSSKSKGLIYIVLCSYNESLVVSIVPIGTRLKSLNYCKHFT